MNRTVNDDIIGLAVQWTARKLTVRLMLKGPSRAEEFSGEQNHLV